MSERERERARERERESEKEKGKERERETGRARERKRDRECEREREREREREEEREACNGLQFKNTTSPSQRKVSLQNIQPLLKHSTILFRGPLWSEVCPLRLTLVIQE